MTVSTQPPLDRQNFHFCMSGNGEQRENSLHANSVAGLSLALAGAGRGHIDLESTRHDGGDKCE